MEVGKHDCRYGGLFIQVERGSAHAQERPRFPNRDVKGTIRLTGGRLPQESKTLQYAAGGQYRCARLERKRSRKKIKGKLGQLDEWHSSRFVSVPLGFV